MAGEPEVVPERDAVAHELGAVQVRGRVAAGRRERDDRRARRRPRAGRRAPPRRAPARDGAVDARASTTAAKPTLPPVTRRLVLCALAALVAARSGGCCRAGAARRRRRPGPRAGRRSRAAAPSGSLVPDAGPETSHERALGLARARRAQELAARRSAVGSAADRRRTEGARPPGSVESSGRLCPQGGTQPNDRRYPIVRRRRRLRGLLTSESTRIPGLVSIADVAPTALGEVVLSSTPDDDPVGRAARARRAHPRQRHEPLAGQHARRRCHRRARVPRSRAPRVAAFAAGAGDEPRCSASPGVSDVAAVLVAARARDRSPPCCSRARPADAARARPRCSRASSPPTSSRWRSTRPGSRSRRSGRRRTRASTGSRTCSRRCCSSRRSPAPRCSARRFGPAAVRRRRRPLARHRRRQPLRRRRRRRARARRRASPCSAPALVGGGRRAWLIGRRRRAAGAWSLIARRRARRARRRTSASRCAAGPGELAARPRATASSSRGSARPSSPWTSRSSSPRSIVALALLAARLPRLDVPRDARALLVAVLAAIAVSLVVNDSPGDVAPAGSSATSPWSASRGGRSPIPRGLQFGRPFEELTTR